MTAFGWTWEYVDDYMTIPRFESISNFWKESPPVHELLGAFFLSKDGRKSQKEIPIGARQGTPENPRDDGEFQAMMGELGELGVGITTAPPAHVIGVSEEVMNGR